MSDPSNDSPEQIVSDFQRLHYSEKIQVADALEARGEPSLLAIAQKMRRIAEMERDRLEQ